MSNFSNNHLTPINKLFKNKYFGSSNTGPDTEFERNKNKKVAIKECLNLKHYPSKFRVSNTIVEAIQVWKRGRVGFPMVVHTTLLL